MRSSHRPRPGFSGLDPGSCRSGHSFLRRGSSRRVMLTSTARTLREAQTVRASAACGCRSRGDIEQLRCPQTPRNLWLRGTWNRLDLTQRLLRAAVATVVVGSWTGDLDRVRMRAQLERGGLPEEPDLELRADELEQPQDIAAPQLVPQR